MPDDNVIKFRRPPPKKPTPQQPGKPSLVVAIVVAVIVAAIVAGITVLFGGNR
jgi:hypothetical protein